jgi:hypothetical protein
MDSPYQALMKIIIADWQAVVVPASRRTDNAQLVFISSGPIKEL